MLGVGRALRDGMPDCQVHLCEPSNAPMMKSGIRTHYPKHGYPSTSFDSTHPVWNPHLFQGWATDFIPKLAHQSKKEKLYDTIEHVKGNDGVWVSRELAQKEGIFVGISGGGILAATLAFAQTCEPGTTLLAMLTDTGERYMSTALFDNIPTEMTPEELALSKTTPGRAPPRPPALSGLLPEDTDDLFDM